MDLNPNKLTIPQVMESFREFGLSKLDSELLADCINVQKACTWQNNDEITDEAVEKAKAFLNENKLGILVEVTPSRFGKFIWETKKEKD
ncbi:hypothetical protein COU37_02885 [Candidatus Micrarchaeota archaeon CG10_big_fil_rev_8_21_14_0_10_45_29]|nr:MAG: hypothetical protein COU37_02885 [Candidatus Micrarchaeota archaeon CG10_big_fil_rev_8_21_14_0_10_45_29]